MSRLFSMRAETIQVDPDEFNQKLASLEKLASFTLAHYCLAEKEHFFTNIIKPELPGLIITSYDEEDEITGFTRIYHQPITARGKIYMTYTANTFTTPLHQLSTMSIQQGINHALQYKLNHPEEELVYFASVNTPWRYQFLSNLSTTLYPKLGEKIPYQALALANALKQAHQWRSSAKHPLIIQDQPIPKNNHMYADHCVTETESIGMNYFKTINLDAHQGEALLVYIPLNLISIGFAIRQLMGLKQPMEDYALARFAQQATEHSMMV